MKFSIIVPVYNRPEEVFELLNSLSEQTFFGFEIVLVEDGSTKPCAQVVEQFRAQSSVSEDDGSTNHCIQEAGKTRKRFPIQYIVKENTGRSDSRNVGMSHAKGDYFLFFDSDCILPPHYLETVNRLLIDDYVDFFGGPDKELPSFSPMQKAINYAMTSFWTTGGIRGGKKNMKRFEPRTFNMGFSRNVFEVVGGFRDMFGEDIDLCHRIRRSGFSIKLFSEAFVYHKRRVSLKKFYKQVHIFGQARINIHKLHPGSLRIVHTLPALAVSGSLILLLLAVLISPWFLFLHAVYLLLLFTDSLVKTKNLRIAGLSLITSFIQIIGYGIGFINSFVKKVLLRQGFEEYEKILKVYK